MTDIGYLANSRYADDIYVVIDAYNYNTGNFETIIGPEKVWDQNYGSITDYYSTEFISDGESGIWNSFIRYNSNNFGNNFVLHFSSAATDYDYENYLEPYGLSKSTDLHLYIGDSHTAISGDGYLDLDNTFNDNYKDDYNNQIDNSLNNHDSNVNNDKIIGSLDSINDALTETTDPSFASGDFPLYEVDDPTVNFFDYLINRISTVFLTNDAVNLNINIPYLTNGDYLLNSDFFVLSGPLLLFIQAFLFIFLILPKLNDVHEIIKAMQMGYTDTFINYFGYGISINDLL